MYFLGLITALADLVQSLTARISYHFVLVCLLHIKRHSHLSYCFSMAFFLDKLLGTGPLACSDPPIQTCLPAHSQVTKLEIGHDS